MGYDRNPRGNQERDRFDGARSDYYGPAAARDYGAGSYNSGGYAQRDDYARGGYGQQPSYAGGYGRPGEGYGEEQGFYGNRDRGGRDFGRDNGGRDNGRQPQGYDYADRGFIDRAGDEVRSWFGDEEAERRRDADLRADQRFGGQQRDDDYHSWRRSQVDALDRDYDEYRRENRSRFENEFSTWRTERQGQRSSLSRVQEHMEVVGSDDSHVGTVDKVRGDRILLTKEDQDAGGRHHSIPSRWIQSVDDKITLSKTAEEAQGHWRDEERNQAFFGDEDRDDNRETGGRMLNRSFSDTY